MSSRRAIGGRWWLAVARLGNSQSGDLARVSPTLSFFFFLFFFILSRRGIGYWRFGAQDGKHFCAWLGGFFI